MVRLLKGGMGEASLWWLEDLGPVMLCEAVLVLIVLIWAVRAPLSGAHWFQSIEDWVRPVLDRPGLQLLIVALVAVLSRASMLPVTGIPAPAVHDEHSLMLQAQTYAAGRIANPTHPLWPHFENIHISQQPSYASIYFAGRSFPMLAGIWMAGQPWLGVWLSSILMAVAVCWMLQAWAPPGYAFLGGILTVVRFGVFSYWVNSYWGGAFTAIGGALVLGAVPRFIQHRRAPDAALMGLGLFILLTTRPYEGLLFCIPVAVFLSVWLLRQARPFLPAFGKLVLPVAAFALAGVTANLVYFWQVTGSPWKPPYELNRKAYARAPAFLISEPYPQPTYRRDRLRVFYDWEWVSYARRYSVKGVGQTVVAKLRQLWSFYLGFALSIPFFVSLFLLRNRKVLFLVLTGSFMIAGYLLETWGFAHYTSPIAGLILALIVMGFERMRSWQWRGEPTGLFLSRALIAVCIVVLVVPAAASVFGWPVTSAAGRNWCCAIPKASYRQTTLDHLEQSPGKDLVIVHYGPKYDVHTEWVYNEPNIDGASVVWAHDLGDQQNRKLIEHFRDRKVWLLTLEVKNPELQPYPGAVLEAGR